MSCRFCNHFITVNNDGPKLDKFDTKLKSGMCRAGNTMKAVTADNICSVFSMGMANDTSMAEHLFIQLVEAINTNVQQQTIILDFKNQQLEVERKKKARADKVKLNNKKVTKNAKKSVPDKKRSIR